MLKLDHVVFPVADAGKTLDFYREVLGLPLIAAHSGDDWEGFPWLMMIFALAGGQELASVALDGGPPLDHRSIPLDTRHYAMSVASDAELEGWRTRLAAHGVAFREEDHGGQHSLYFPDPDGVVLEITTPASDASPDEAADAVAEARRWIARARLPA